jgi:hypothetical protein
MCCDLFSRKPHNHHEAKIRFGHYPKILDRSDRFYEAEAVDNCDSVLEVEREKNGWDCRVE